MCKKRIMEELIRITLLNDFIFCPISIYFHNLYGNMDDFMYNTNYQIEGKNAHKSIDDKTYSSKKDILQSIDVYSEKYGLIGKIDIYDIEKQTLIERKKTVKRIYDGYIFQVYAQYYALKEMGYDVKKIIIHSLSDNKNYNIELPEVNNEMRIKFEELINKMKIFNIEGFSQENKEKCKKCIYESACSGSKIK